MNPPVQGVLPNSVSVRFRSTDLSWETLPSCEANWAHDDLGPMTGSIIVERFRTFGSQLPNLDYHRERLALGANHFGFDNPMVEKIFDDISHRLIEANIESIAREDCSIVLLLSPSLSGWIMSGSIQSLPISRLSEWYEFGTQLFTTRYRAIPNSSFPTSIKHRSRIHYWLSDRQASQISQNAIALLQTPDLNLADTSVANIILIGQDGNWRTPSEQHCHVGTTLRRSNDLLTSNGIRLEFTSLDRNDLLNADEVIMTGATGLVWNVASVDAKTTYRQTKHCRQLQQLWMEFLNFDFLKGMC